MTTLIEKDSSAPAIFLIFVLFLLLGAGGFGFAYMTGAFGEKTTVIENTKMIENKTVVPPVPSTPARASEPGKPAEPTSH